MKALLVIVFAILTMGFEAQADSFPGCTDWERDRGVGCIFNGRSGIKFVRDCSALEEDDRYEEYRKFLCKRRASNPRHPGSDRCLAMGVCMPNLSGYAKHPDHLDEDCTDWIEYSGISCTPNGRRGSGKMWSRACTWTGVKMATSACTPRRKRYPTREDWLIY